MKKAVLFYLAITCISLLGGFALLEGTVRALGLAPQHQEPGAVGLAKITRFDGVLETVYEPNSSTQITSPYGEFDLVYTIDGSGFRMTRPGSAEGHLVHTQKAQHRMLFLGNSFVEGWGLADDQTFTEELQRLGEARRVDSSVSNAGISGYGTAQSYLLAKQLLRTSDADLVVFFFVPSMVHADAKFIPRASLDEDRLVTGLDIDVFLNQSGPGKGSEPWFNQPWAKNAERYSAAFRLLFTRLRVAHATEAIATGDPTSDLFAAVRPSVDINTVMEPSLRHIAALAELVTKGGKKFALVHLPLPNQISPIEWDLGRVPYRFEEPVSSSPDADAVRTLCEENGLTCWFAHQILQEAAASIETDARIYYRYDFHLNPDGAQILAGWLDARLTEACF
ncbi:MAG: SGNH/GDSL hydrolase family protein [Parvibaculaceae bacterium]|nr:SGNH/GDSL hydrolase family protein [Parvibaculaceae bacterium]